MIFFSKIVKIQTLKNFFHIFSFQIFFFFNDLLDSKMLEFPQFLSFDSDKIVKKEGSLQRKGFNRQNDGSN